MGHIEFARITNDGVEWVDINDATPSELLDIELGLFNEGAI